MSVSVMITAQHSECNNISIPTIGIPVYKIMSKKLADLSGRFMICAWISRGAYCCYQFNDSTSLWHQI
jgi:hypothetical protein